jgi:hypothetical protein
VPARCWEEETCPSSGYVPNRETLPRHALFLILVLAAVAGALIFLLLSQGELGGESPPTALGGDPSLHPPARLFSPVSVWNTALAPRAPVDPSSDRVVAGLLEEVAREKQEGTGPWITASTCSTPLYVVSPDQPTVEVRLIRPHEAWRAGLAKVFRRVPIPPRAEPADCSDAHLTVWQPRRDKLWEFFKLRRDGAGWAADWGGAIRHVSSSLGFYGPRSWPGLSNFSWGATATSLPVIAGVMRLDELERGRIDHVLAMNVPAARAGVFSWPAQRSDGVGRGGEVPEGAQLRLDPALDLSGLDLPPLTAAIAEAAQKYGIIVRDQTGPGNGISFFGEAPTTPGTRPYSEPGGFYGGMTPDELLADFPWERLQLLKMSLCRSGPCRR